MPGPRKYETASPKEMKMMVADMLKQNSPALLDSGLKFFNDNIDSQDPHKQKLAIDVWKTLIGKALPNQTKHQIENTQKVDAKYLEYLENKRKQISSNSVENAEYEVEDE